MAFGKLEMQRWSKNKKVVWRNEIINQICQRHPPHIEALCCFTSGHRKVNLPGVRRLGWLSTQIFVRNRFLQPIFINFVSIPFSSVCFWPLDAISQYKPTWELIQTTEIKHPRVCCIAAICLYLRTVWGFQRLKIILFKSNFQKLWTTPAEFGLSLHTK